MRKYRFGKMKICHTNDWFVFLRVPQSCWKLGVFCFLFISVILFSDYSTSAGFFYITSSLGLQGVNNMLRENVLWWFWGLLVMILGRRYKQRMRSLCTDRPLQPRTFSPNWFCDIRREVSTDRGCITTLIRTTVVSPFWRRLLRKPSLSLVSIQFQVVLVMGRFRAGWDFGPRNPPRHWKLTVGVICTPHRLEAKYAYAALWIHTRWGHLIPSGKYMLVVHGPPLGSLGRAFGSLGAHHNGLGTRFPAFKRGTVPPWRTLISGVIQYKKGEEIQY